LLAQQKFFGAVLKHLFGKIGVYKTPRYKKGAGPHIGPRGG